MLVVVENFGKYVDRREFTFVEGAITLIKGRSGIGKTTIFKAVVWALYGTIKGYRNHKHPNKRTYVCFAISNISIERSMPYDLKFHQRNSDNTVTTVTGESAQSEINKFFGVEDTFRAACFRQQQSQNILMDGSSANKLSLMKTITFGSEDSTIDPIIERIAADVQKYNTLTANAISELAAATARYQSAVGSLAGGDISMYQPVTPDQLVEWQQQYQLAIQEKSQLDVRLGKYNLAKSLLAGIEEKIVNNRKEMEDIGDVAVMRDEVKQMEQRMMNDNMTTLQLRQKLQSITTQQQRLMELSNQYIHLKSQAGNYLSLDECSGYQQSMINLNKIMNEWIAYQRYVDVISQLEKRVEISRSNYTNGSAIPEEFLGDIPTFKKLLTESIAINKHNTAVSTQKSNFLNTLKLVWSTPDGSLPTLEQLLSIKNRLEEYCTAVKGSAKRKEWEIQYANIQRLEVPPSFEPEELVNVRTRIYDLEKQQHEYNHLLSYIQNKTMGAKIQNCPKCSSELMVVGGSIVTPEKPPAPPDVSSLTSLRGRLQELTTLQQKNDEYHNRVNIFKSLPEPQIIEVVTVGEVTDPSTATYLINQMSNLTQVLSSLSNIKSQPIEGDLVRLTNLQLSVQHYEQYLQCVKELDEAKRNKVEQPNTSMAEVQSNINRLQRMYPSSIQYHQKVTTLDKELESLKYSAAGDPDKISASIKEMEDNLQITRKNIAAKIETIKRYDSLVFTYNTLLIDKKQHEENVRDDIPAMLNECVGKINKITADINNGQRYLFLEKELQFVNEKQAVVNQTRTIHQSLSRLLTYANNADYGALQEVVDAINSILPQLIDTLFETPIGVRLDMYKEMKAVNTYSQGRIISKILLTVTNDNEEFSPVMLSGGEQDRISFALTIALNKIIKSPLIMLDEAFSSLCNEDKVTAMQLLRSQCPGITVLSIVHDGIDGLYDYQMHFNK